MKKSVTTFMIILVSGLISLGFSPTAKADDALQTLQEAFRIAAGNLNEQYSRIKECPEEGTWLPQLGLRGLYCHVKQYLNYEWVQSLTMEEIFHKGPHSRSHLDLKSQFEFGYYNADFIKGFREEIIMHFTSDADFRATTQIQYDQHLKKMVRSYHRAYKFLDAGTKWVVNRSDVESNGAAPVYLDPETVRRNYISHLENKTLPKHYFFEIFRQPSDIIAGDGDEWINVSTALGWWIRRSIDETAIEFFQVLELFMETYDANF